MSKSLQHPSQADVVVPAPAGTTTADAADCAPRCDGPGGTDLQLFGDVAPDVRMRMELLARASASPETALPHVVALLVEGAEAREAIITAIVDNPQLHDQWCRAWGALRS